MICRKMFKFKLNKVFYLLVFCVFCLTHEIQAKLFDATEFYLNNGLRVIVNENHKAPIAKLMLWYKVGAMDEMPGKSGLAHLLEHLMFRGTSQIPNSKFNEIMLINGVENNAFTSRDFTVYHALTDISRLELVMALEADRMANLQINDKAFQNEQKVVYQEREQRVKNNSKTQFGEEVNKILWQGTPYEHPISGTLEEINTLTKEDALMFYHKYYSPSNAVLVVSGDITPKEIKPLVEKYFGHIKSDQKASRSKTTFTVFEKSDISIYKEMPHIESPKILITYIIPSILENAKEAFALSVFSNYLGESGNSYFQKELVQKQKVLSAGSDVDILYRGSGTFTISMLPLENSDLKENVSLLETSISQALLKLNSETIKKEKKKILSTLIYVKDNPEDAAYIIGTLASLGLGLDEIENYASNIENVSLEDVKKAVENMLAHSKKVTAILAPEQEIEND